MVAVFAAGVDAVAAAVDAQRCWREPWPPPNLAVRMAVHTGEADLRDELYYGGEASSVRPPPRARPRRPGPRLGVTADVVGDRLPGAARPADLGVHRLKALRTTPAGLPAGTIPSSPGTFPPLRSLDTARATLPLVLTGFVGRALSWPRAGAPRRSPPGDARRRRRVRQDRLATSLAESTAERLDGGVWWVELAPLTDADAVAHAAHGCARHPRHAGRGRRSSALAGTLPDAGRCSSWTTASMCWPVAGTWRPCCCTPAPS